MRKRLFLTERSVTGVNTKSRVKRYHLSLLTSPFFLTVNAIFNFYRFFVMPSSLYFILEAFSSYYGNGSPLNSIFNTKKNDNRYNLICPFALEADIKNCFYQLQLCVYYEQSSGTN